MKLGLLIYFSKAFDCVKHTTLLDIFACYGVRGTSLSLIHSYPEHRKHDVSLNDCASYFLFLTSCAPQGSTLGPLVFTVYTNDIVNTNQESRVIMCTEDTSIFLSATHINKRRANANALEQINFIERKSYLKIKFAK